MDFEAASSHPLKTGPSGGRLGAEVALSLKTERDSPEKNMPALNRHFGTPVGLLREVADLQWFTEIKSSRKESVEP
jgi:hypothetical protein